MASEIRVNKIINRSGLSTVTFSDTGAIVSGIVTANSFSGNVTGNVTGSGANLTSLPAANLTGTLPAISGANLTSLPAQATIANNADNRVITGGSGVNLNGESGLTFSGNALSINTNGSRFAENNVRFQSSGAAYIDHATTGQDINFRTSVSSSLDTTGMTLKSNGNLAFASGKGIDFSATADGTGSSQAEILDDYEEGSWTPAVASGNASFSTMTGRYTKIGNQVTIWVKISGGGSYSGSGALQISGIPFSNSTAVHPIGNSEYYKILFANGYSNHVTPYLSGNNLQWLRNASSGGSGNYLTIDLFYTSASINTTLTYITNS